MSREDEPKTVQYDDDEEYYSDDEVDAGSCGIMLTCLALVMGGVLCGFGIYAGAEGYGAAWTSYIGAALGFLLFVLSIIGCVGFCSGRTGILASYFSLLLFSVVALWVTAGYCFVYSAQAADYIQANWADISSRSDSDVTEEELKEETERNLQVSGALAMSCTVFSVMLMCQTAAKISAKKAQISFLQVTNFMLLPLGILLVVGALYIADAAALASTPVTSFAIFVLGSFVVSVSLLGCFSTAIQSRGLLLLSIYITLPIGVALAGFSIFAAVQADEAKQLINENWDQIRLVLPHTFSGRFDREAFATFVEANLFGLAFMAFTMAIMLLSQAFVARKLRKTLKDESREEAAALELAADAFEARSQAQSGDRPQLARQQSRLESLQMRSRERMKAQWKKQWTKGTRFSRNMIKCGCAACCVVVLVVVGLATSAIVFSTSCEQLASVSETAVYTAPASDVRTLRLRSTYSRGELRVSPHPPTSSPSSSVLVNVKSQANSNHASHATPGTLQWEPEGEGNTATLTVVPQSPPRLFSYDITCQTAEVTAKVPAGSSDTTVDASSEADYDGLVVGDGATTLSLYGVKAQSTLGGIELKGVHVGHGAVTATSQSGAVLVQQSHFSCAATDKGAVETSSDLGGVTMSGVAAVNCPVSAATTFAPIRVRDISLSDSVGTRAAVRATTEKGAIELENVRAPEVDVRSDKGVIRADGVNVTRSAFLVASTSGAVTLCNVATSGNIEVETDTGDVFIQVPKGGFSGIFSINTEGPVSLQGDGVVEQDSSSGERRGTVFCDEFCSYYGGEIIITSRVGAVTLLAGDGACDANLQPL